MKKIYFIYFILSIMLFGCSRQEYEEKNLMEASNNTKAVLDAEEYTQEEISSKFQPIMVLKKNNNDKLNKAYVIGANNENEWFDLNYLDLPKTDDEDYIQYSNEPLPFENDYIKIGDSFDIYSLHGMKKSVTVNETTLWFSPRSGSTTIWAYFDEYPVEESIFIGSKGVLNIHKEKLNYIKDGENLLELDLDNNGVEDAIFIEESNPLYEDGDSLKIRIRFNDSLIDIERYVFPSTGENNDFWLIPIDFNNDNKYELFTYTSMNGMVIDIYELSDKEALNVLNFYDGD